MTFARRCQAPLRLAALALSMVMVCSATLFAQTSRLQLPAGDARESIRIQAESGEYWRQGAYEVWLLRGRCELRQGSFLARGGEAVLWIDRSAPYSGEQSRVLAYLEPGAEPEVRIENAGNNGRGSSRMLDRTWFGRLHTVADVQVQVPQARPRGATASPVYDRGVRASPFRDLVAPAQFTEAAPAESSRMRFGGRSITLRGRGNTRPVVKHETNPATNESVMVIPGGVNLVLDDVYANNVGDQGAVALGQIDIEADSVVVWTVDLSQADLFGGNSVVGDEIPLELYLEGNVVFRQGDTVIYADRMYYNASNSYGVVLEAEMLTPVPEYEGLMRLKADVLQQIDRQNFVARNAALTSSRLGVPGYWLQSDTLQLQDQRTPAVDPFTGQLARNEDGQPIVQHDFLATSHSNFLYVGGVPVLYWPTIATDLRRPTYYVEGLKVKNDNIFGQQIYLDLDVYQILGIRRPPPGTKFTFSPNYLSERGPALGANFEYQGFQLLGHPGPYQGMIDAWGIWDEGLDSLGSDRLAVPISEELRGRVLWQHRHDLHDQWQFTAEVGLISDRNFLEQYLEREWDQYKDQTTGLELKKYWDSSTLSLSTDARVNDFFTQTEWLPRLDHYVLGHSAFGIFTWHAHSHVGYGRLKNAALPAAGTEPVQSSLPWELDGATRFTDRDGVRAATRQEIDLPFSLGPVEITPYLLGEAAYWGSDIADDDVTRLYGQVGVRSSLPFWTANRAVQSELWNLNGLAHKVTLESEFLYADADQDVTRLALYDPLDDDAQEHFIRRFITTSHGGALPAQYDHRLFALRSGLQSWVASPSTEIADDLMLFRMAARQRWQTKRGLPGQERLVDWITLDVEANLYPKNSRDNFGEDLGMVDYDFRWQIGDRVSLLSDGFADVFSQGLRSVAIGGMISRPERGNLYVGFRTIEGPITSNVLSASLSYRMTEKWIADATTSFDFGPTGNIGQRIGLVRIGESALIRIGFNIDEGRENVGVAFSIEPRFLPRGRLGRVGGVQIPPAGARGLE